MEQFKDFRTGNPIEGLVCEAVNSRTQSMYVITPEDSSVKCPFKIIFSSFTEKYYLDFNRQCSSTGELYLKSSKGYCCYFSTSNEKKDDCGIKFKSEFDNADNQVGKLYDIFSAKRVYFCESPDCRYEQMNEQVRSTALYVISVYIKLCQSDSNRPSKTVSRPQPDSQQKPSENNTKNPALQKLKRRLVFCIFLMVLALAALALYLNRFFF